MADTEAALRGILERNMAAAVSGETAGYHLNHVTVELDTSEVSILDEGLEGLPISVEGRFETREHPEGSIRWVFKARSVRAEVPGQGAPPSAEVRPESGTPPVTAAPGEDLTPPEEAFPPDFPSPPGEEQPPRAVP